MKTHVAEIAAAGYFASGLNNKAEPRAVTLAGYNMGISCAVLSEALLLECESACRDHYVKLFVDSGAFAEVTFVPGQGLVTKKEITDADWQTIFATYRRLAKSCGHAAYLVAPDKVGDQVETLARMKRYAATMQELRAIRGFDDAGPRIIVPVQNGAMTPADFATAACEALGMSEEQLIWGIPLKKGATTIEQLAAFAASCQADASFHLLGMGPASPRFEAAVDAILEACPEATITCDAVRVTALVGRHPLRPLTAAQDRLRALHPDAEPHQIKGMATQEVLGEESVRLLLDNGWVDAELEPALDWKAAVESLFADGAAHTAAEAKALVAEEAHPNAVTNVINALARQGALVRRAPGLYVRSASAGISG